MDGPTKVLLSAAKSYLPEGYVIVPLKPTPGMMEQAAHNLAAEYGPEETMRLKEFAFDVYREFIVAGMVR